MNKPCMLSKLYIAVGFAAALSSAEGVLAGEAGAKATHADRQGQETKSEIVRYTPAALADSGGAEALYAEIEAAARRVCGEYDIKRLRARQRWNECYETALADALAQVSDRRLAGLGD